MELSPWPSIEPTVSVDFIKNFVPIIWPLKSFTVAVREIVPVHSDSKLSECRPSTPSIKILVGVLAELSKMLPVIFVPHVSVHCRLLSRIFFWLGKCLCGLGWFFRLNLFC